MCYLSHWHSWKGGRTRTVIRSPKPNFLAQMGYDIFLPMVLRVHIIKKKLHVSSKIRILCFRGKNNISLVRCAHSESLFFPLKVKFISSRHRVISSMNFRLKNEGKRADLQSTSVKDSNGSYFGIRCIPSWK